MIGEEMMDEGDVSKTSQKDSISPTQPLLLSQHADILKYKSSAEQAHQANSPKPKSQSLEEILGGLNSSSPNGKTTAGKAKLSPLGLKNNEVISNSSSPFENENLARNQEIQANKDKILLDVELTDEQNQIKQNLAFGATKVTHQLEVQLKK